MPSTRRRRTTAVPRRRPSPRLRDVSVQNPLVDRGRREPPGRRAPRCTFDTSRRCSRPLVGRVPSGARRCCSCPSYVSRWFSPPTPASYERAGRVQHREKPLSFLGKGGPSHRFRAKEKPRRLGPPSIATWCYIHRHGAAPNLRKLYVLRPTASQSRSRALHT